MSALVIWRISDGRAGHDNQSIGLAEALARRCDCQIHTIAAQPRLAAGMQWLRQRYTPATRLPQPTLIIGAGEHTHPDLLAARRYSGAPAIVIMRPSLPYRWFDLCLIPEHDQPPRADNIIPTRGALNRMQPGNNDPGRGLILVGGPSRHHDWDKDSLIEQIECIAAHGDPVHWTVTDSPRTPAATRSALAGLHITGRIRYQPFNDSPPGWLAAALPESGQAWVSEDSVSMVYEALSAGARVGLLKIPSRHPGNRLEKGIKTLITDQYVMPFNEWKIKGVLGAPPHLLSETERCAGLIQQRFLSQSSP